MKETPSLENVELSLVDSIKSEQLVEMGSDAAELVLDQLLDNGILQDIPVFGTLYKMGKFGLGIREQYFAKKVYTFLFNIREISSLERERFINDLEEHTSQRAGETLLILLDKLDNIEKPKILSNLMKARIHGDISINKFLRLSCIAEKVFIHDLKELYKYIEKEQYHEDVSESLAALGLINITTIDAAGDPGFKYSISNLGRDMLKHGLNNS